MSLRKLEFAALFINRPDHGHQWPSRIEPFEKAIDGSGGRKKDVANHRSATDNR